MDSPPWPPAPAAPAPPVGRVTSLQLLLCGALLLAMFSKFLWGGLPTLVLAPALVLALRRPLCRWAGRAGLAAPFVLWLSALPLALPLASMALWLCEVLMTPVGQRDEMYMEYHLFPRLFIALLLLALGGVPGHLLEMRWRRRSPGPRLVAVLWDCTRAALCGSAASLLWGAARMHQHGVLLPGMELRHGHPQALFGGAGWLLGPLLTLLVAASVYRQDRALRRLLAGRGAWRAGDHEGQGQVRIAGEAGVFWLPPASPAPVGPVVVQLPTAPPGPAYREQTPRMVHLLAPGTPQEHADALQSQRAEAAAYLLCAAVLLTTPLLCALLFPAHGILR